MPRDPNCIFCKIVSANVPAQVVYEDEAVISFLDIAPLAEGHLLVVPREHYAKLTDVPPELCGKIGSTLPILGRVLKDVTQCEGFNTLVNEGKAAGQLVEHVHFHLIPRKSSDGLGYRWNAGAYREGRAADLAAEFQRAISRHV